MKFTWSFNISVKIISLSKRRYEDTAFERKYAPQKLVVKWQSSQLSFFVLVLVSVNAKVSSETWQTNTTDKYFTTNSTPKER